MSDKKTTDYCGVCGESPDSGSHLFHHDYIDDGQDELDRAKMLRDVFRETLSRGYVQINHEHTVDSLDELFLHQEGFMMMLKADGRFPTWPLDLKSKENQRKLQGYLWDTVREISEASAALKNRIHRVQEQEFDREAFLEEMADAFAFFMESLIMAGFNAEDLRRKYFEKMEIVREGLVTGGR